MDEIIPGGLGSIEKIKGEPIEETLGYSHFKEKFKELKENADKKLEEGEGEIWKEADEKRVSAISKLEEKQPRIPLYDDLPEKQQRMVFREGEKQFSK